MIKNHINIIFTAFLLFISVSLAANSFQNTLPDDDKYENIWNKVDSLEHLGLTKSALGIVEEIYTMAKADNNSEQFIKAIIFKLKYKKELNDSDFVDLIKDIENELDTSEFPVRNILHSMLADMYWMYYKLNHQDIYKRKNIADLGDGISVWTAGRIRAECMKHYQLSLSDQEKLQKLPITDFAKIIIDAKEEENLRAVLYDFLAHKAISFFKDTDFNLSNYKDNFQLKDSFYFADAAIFSNQLIQTKDTLSLHFNVLKIYRQLLAFRINDTNVPALINVDLERLNFVYKYSAKPNKDSLYLLSLQNIADKYKEDEASTEINYCIASYYFNKDKKKALEICEQSIKKHPKSFGAKQCNSLKSMILNAKLNFKAEAYISFGQKFPVLVNYKNIDTVYIKIARINAGTLKNLQEKYHDKKLYNKLLLSVKQEKNTVRVLAKADDYQEHNTELMLPAQALGTYLVFVANNEKFSYEKNTVSYLSIQVTNLSYIKRIAKNGDWEFYVLNRKTGAPMKSVLVKTSYKTYDFKTGKHNIVKAKSYFTDKDGFFRVSAKQAGRKNNLQFVFSKAGDVLETESFNQLNYNEPYNSEYTLVRLFTDKAVYRPGQKVYFKGIVLKSSNGQLELSSEKRKMMVRFYHRQKQTIIEKELPVNEFGSFTSSFSIPENQANGELEIYTVFGSKTIKVLSVDDGKYSDTEQFNGNELANISTGTYLSQNGTLNKNSRLKDEKKVGKQINYFVPIKTIVVPGEKASFLIGSAAKNVSVLYEIVHKGQIIKKQWIKISENQELIEIPVQEDYQGNFSVHFSFVKNNRFYSNTATVQVPYTTKALDISIQSFRNKLHPGEQEEWKIKIKTKNGAKELAELMVTLYDASMDKLTANSWAFDIYEHFYPQLSWTSDVFYLRTATVVNKGFYQNIPMPYRKYAFLNWFGFTNNYTDFIDYKLNDGLLKKKKECLPNNIMIGNRFNETAFFYPDLKTDKDGNVPIKFTAPKYAGKWHLKIFAHSKDLKFGLLDKELITKNDLVVAPNVPDFFRQGDHFVFSVKIKNTAKEKMEGIAYLSFFDAKNRKPLSNVFAENELGDKLFSVEAGGNSELNWNLQIPDDVRSVVYKIVAKSGKFSDGEQKEIPVLSKQVLVTETLPFFIKGKQSKTYELKELVKSKKSKTIKNDRLSFEFTSNPLCFALQTLPYLASSPDESTLQTFNQFYVDCVERLFDKNKTATKSKLALNDLVKLQLPNGAWPWFKTMPGDRYITQKMIAGFGSLNKLGVKNIREDKKLWQMLRMGINYMDRKITEDYDSLKKSYIGNDLQKAHLSNIAIHYLYARSFFPDIKVPQKTAEAFAFYKKQVKKHWSSQNLYAKGMAALIAHRYHIKFAEDVVSSLKKTANTEKHGMYWKKNKAGYLWYQSPIATQAIMLEVFEEVAKDKQLAWEIRIWLLKQKQLWNKTDKIFALGPLNALLSDKKEKSTNNDVLKIKISGQDLDTKAMAVMGTEYFRKVWFKDEIKPSMGKISLQKNGAGNVYGALSWQYFEDIDKVKAKKNALKLEKKLYLVSAKGLKEISKKTKLKQGDKIMLRLILKTATDMEYLHIKDMWASGLEPISFVSGNKFTDGINYYESAKNTAISFFVPALSKGRYIFEHTLVVAHRGEFSTGIATVQSMYAPGFSAHSKSIKIKVE